MKLSPLPGIGRSSPLTTKELTGTRARINRAILEIERRMVQNSLFLNRRLQTRISRLIDAWRRYGAPLEYDTPASRTVASVSFSEFIGDYNQLVNELERVLEKVPASVEVSKSLRVPSPGSVFGPPPLPTKVASPKPPFPPPWTPIDNIEEDSSERKTIPSSMPKPEPSPAPSTAPGGDAHGSLLRLALLIGAGVLVGSLVILVSFALAYWAMG